MRVVALALRRGYCTPTRVPGLDLKYAAVRGGGECYKALVWADDLFDHYFFTSSQTHYSITLTKGDDGRT